MKSSMLAVLIGLSTPAMAQNEPAPAAQDLIHADLPLFAYGTEEMWPQHIGGEDIGCISRVAFGTWKLHRGGEDDDSWYRIANYGVFHCWARVSAAEDREDLKGADAKPSFFILIDKAPDLELWALQLGARPGSDYILLSRKPEGGIIKRFEVLQRDCPKTSMRKTEPIDILLTNYCAVNSRSDLVTLARKMAKLAPLASLIWVEDEKESD